jgi:DNA-binding SARP family transcriptional activator
MFGVLGPVVAWDATGREIALRGPRHRAVLARLLVARGRVVPVGHLVDDLWVAPPAGAVSSVRTFVAALRRALEPDRPPRARPKLLVTEGPGYALRAAPDAVDAWRFEDAVSSGGPLGEALGWWRGPAYADFPDEPWARAERRRLTELRLRAVEMEAARRLENGHSAEAVPALDAHVTDHPWREEGWRLLALALYRSGRQGDALVVLRRARDLLSAHLGVDPGPILARLEVDILRQEPSLSGPDEVWSSAAATYERLVGVGSRARLETTVGLLRSLAVTGGGDGLGAAQEQRLATIRAAEELGDPSLTARVIGAYDVPAIWPRSDDPARAAEIVAATRRTLAAWPEKAPPGAEPPAGSPKGAAASKPAVTESPGAERASAEPAPANESARARLLATIAVESRGTGTPEDLAAAREAERIARRLHDPALLAFALNGVYMQTFHRCGLAADRDAIGTELIALAAQHGLVTAEVLGHLIRVQSQSALGNLDAAEQHATAADDLAKRHELPLVGVFTTWFRALKEGTIDSYLAAASTSDRAGMPGLSTGLLPLALLALNIRHNRPAEPAYYGPYQPWVTPLLARSAESRLPDPPHDPLAEALWCLTARAAVLHNDRPTAIRARAALRPAAAEHAGAASGLLTLGPVAGFLADLDRLLDRDVDV